MSDRTRRSDTSLPKQARPPQIEGISGFYRAMSLFQQGQPAKARALFAATTAQMKPLPTDDQKPLADHDDLILWLACKEAKALLVEPKAAGK